MVFQREMTEVEEIPQPQNRALEFVCLTLHTMSGQRERGLPLVVTL